VASLGTCSLIGILIVFLLDRRRNDSSSCSSYSTASPRDDTACDVRRNKVLFRFSAAVSGFWSCCSWGGQARPFSGHRTRMQVSNGASVSSRTPYCSTWSYKVSVYETSAFCHHALVGNGACEEFLGSLNMSGSGRREHGAHCLIQTLCGL
jgi:hypothetical protein